MESLFLIVADALIEERIYFLVDETLAHDEGCRLADVTGNPATAQLFGNRCCGAAATKEITDEVAFVGRCLDDTFEEGFGLLGVITNSFLCLRINGINIIPQIRDYISLHIIKKLNLSRISFRIKNYAPFR